MVSSPTPLRGSATPSGCQPEISTGDLRGLPPDSRSTYRPGMRGRIFVAILGVLVVAAPPVRAVDVVVEQDRYVGTHAIITPASVDATTRRQLSECDDCAWRFAEPCISDPDRTGEGCTSVVRGCPAGRRLLRLWFTQRGEPWEDRGLVCLAENDIVDARRVGTEVRERFERRVPGQSPSCEPPRGAVTQLPLVCASGQGGPHPGWNEALLGVDVQLHVAPTWTWDFGPGSRLTTTSPGGSFPDMSVAHTYRTPGARTITVTTEWSGTYTADGLGPFALPTIRQESQIQVVIGQARAVLTRPESPGR